MPMTTTRQRNPRGQGERLRDDIIEAAKLANADFLAKAPQDVVGKIRDRQRVAQEETDRINARLAGLQ